MPLMPLALILLVAGLAAAVVLGPLGLGLIDWRVSANGLNQTLGADAGMLVLVVPVALAAARLWRAGRRLAALLALGVGLATLYYTMAAVLGPDYIRYPGNNERFFLLFLGLIILSWTIAARAWAALDPEPPRPPRWLVRGSAAVLVLGGVVIGFAWIAQLFDIAASGGIAQASDAQAYAEAPSAFWVVRIVDLGFIVPISLAAGVGLWRGSATAIKAAYGVAAFLTLQAADVLAMGAVMLWRQDPTASPVLVYALTPITFASGALTVRLLTSYAGGRDTATPAIHACARAAAHVKFNERGFDMSITSFRTESLLRLRSAHA
ncbi:MAG: hypothetical protein HY332_11555 [Chloroflexi bacterium]|nr:hypothetical protein [Chloroflexota bacterium]